MNEQSITIRWEKIPMAVPIYRLAEIRIICRISARHFYRWTHFLRYISVDERETSGESAGISATTTLLSNLIGIIRKSVKTDSRIVDKNDFDMRFPFTDLPTIRKFAEIAGIEFDERKFSNRREFQMYFRELIKEYKWI